MNIVQFRHKSWRKQVIRLGMLLVLLFLFFENEVVSAQVEPTMTISPTSGPPGTSVTAKGAGFPPGAPLNIALGIPDSQFSGSYAQFVADANGTFEITFRLERHPNENKLLPPRRYVLGAHTADYQFKGLANFTITPGGGAPSGDSGSTMPETMPSAGLGGVKSASGSSGLLLLFTSTTIFGAVGLYLVRRKFATARKR